MPMDDKTDAEPLADRRQGDRRAGETAGYTGPERRGGDRRAGRDRRKTPRF
jgi:hypothetical protein